MFIGNGNQIIFLIQGRMMLIYSDESINFMNYWFNQSCDILQKYNKVIEKCYNGI